MPKTFLDGREVKKWFVDGRQVKKAYLDGRLIFRSEIVIEVNAHRHDFHPDNVWLGLINAQCTGGRYDGRPIRIVIGAGVQAVSAVGAPRNLYLWRSLNNIDIPEWIIENHGYLLGRGGQGGNAGYGNSGAGQIGATAIDIEYGNKVTIYNHGVIGGGGGGSAGSRSQKYRDAAPAAGGAPFGAAGTYTGGMDWLAAGGAAWFDRGGKASGNVADSTDGSVVDPKFHCGAGSGGMWGQAGATAWSYDHADQGAWVAVGQPGRAVGISTESVTWAVKGDIRGAYQ